MVGSIVGDAVGSKVSEVGSIVLFLTVISDGETEGLSVGVLLGICEGDSV